jgi:hypothetical protein
MATPDEVNTANEEYVSILSQLSGKYKDIIDKQKELASHLSTLQSAQENLQRAMAAEAAGLKQYTDVEGKQKRISTRTLIGLESLAATQTQLYLSQLQSLTKVIQDRVNLEEEAYLMDAQFELAKQQINSAMGFNRLTSVLKTVEEKSKLFAANIPGVKMLIFGEILMRAGEALMKLRDTIYRTQEKLGVTFDTSISALAGAYTNVITSYFSKGPQLKVEDTISAINEYQKEFGTILTRGAAQDIAQSSKSFGTSVEIFVRAQRAFLGAGGLANQAKLQSQFITQFRNAGLTANQALTFAANNANLVAIAGVKYADSLARAAANAQRIGVSLNKTEQFADNLVGNFEGALENFAELNAMGFNIDFNKLAQVAGTGTPEEVQKELSAQFGGNQQLLNELQRNRFLKVSLERDLGLDIGEITRLAKGEEALPAEKTQEEKIQDGINQGIIKGLGPLLTGIGGLVSVVNPQTLALIANTAALVANTATMGSSGMFGKLLGGTAGRVGVGAAGLTVGVGSAMAGRELVEQGNTKTGMGLGLLGGAAGGLLLASALAPFTGGASLALYGGLAAAGGLGGLRYAASGMKSEEGDDVISSPGYGSRVLVTPTETISLNNKDTVMAGTKLLSAGALTSPMTAQQQAPAVTNTVNVDMSKLEAKLDRLASAFAGIKIEMDGNTVGRVSLNARSPMDRLSVVG